MSPSAIVASTVVAIVALGALTYWDEGKEAAAALADFAAEQEVLARQAAAALRTANAPSTMPKPNETERMRAAFGAIEDSGAIVGVLRTESGLATPQGVVRAERLEHALDTTRCTLGSHAERGACSLQLSHDESVALGLPPRMGMAGFAAFTSDDGRRTAVAVVATAKRERDRERHAALRLVLSFVVSSSLVLALGTLALRKLRRELAIVSELRLAEALRARDERLVRADKLATLGALATGIAHEVSTPLGVIVGRAEQLVPRVAGDERATRSVTAILQQAARIEQVIRAFLTLVRGGVPSLEHADPRELARAAIEVVEHRFTQAGVRLVADDGPTLPEIACDRRLLEQALVNLLLNACDACKPGDTVALEVALEEGHVAFLVSDDGSGISADAAARATEPFFTTKPAGLGSGLGLAITKEIVQHHRGTLSVGPRQGRCGTVARISLPAVAHPAARGAA